MLIGEYAEPRRKMAPGFSDIPTSYAVEGLEGCWEC